MDTESVKRPMLEEFARSFDVEFSCAEPAAA
jgi:hypothetical protein